MMPILHSRWRRLSGYIDQFTLRERVLAGAATGALVLFTTVTFCISPLIARQEQLSLQIARQNEDAAALQNQIAEMTRLAPDPQADRGQREAALQSRLAALDGDGQAAKSVPTEKMADLVGAVIRRNPRLRLVSLRNLPAVRADEQAAGSAKPPLKPAPGPTIYRHGIDVTLEGSYRDLSQYVRELESSLGRIGWARATVKMGDSANATLALQLYILNSNQAWLTI